VFRQRSSKGRSAWTAPTTPEGTAVADQKIDDLHGRAKEAAGDLADDSDLKQDGQADRASAGAKGKVDELVGTAQRRA